MRLRAKKVQLLAYLAPFGARIVKNPLKALFGMALSQIAANISDHLILLSPFCSIHQPRTHAERPTLSLRALFNRGRASPKVSSPPDGVRAQVFRTSGSLSTGTQHSPHQSATFAKAHSTDHSQLLDVMYPAETELEVFAVSS
ncbi:unnamed protein product [Protopolystoma xenopodis]|uniref:Uncharacterized protein n=1 Tax=Protopolystoma xenopodis TaxID=117903 RepID=A0A448WNB9_9PLAT|nr:unnamed protein product [Protopolystoma xenopodis]